MKLKQITICSVLGIALLFGATPYSSAKGVHTLEKGTIVVTDTLLSEDFAKFTEGSESKPSSTNLAASGTIASKYTKVSGWTGEYVYQAGGSAYIAMDDWGWYPGKIVTPSFDASAGTATFTVTFRAKSTYKSDKVIVNRKSSGNQYVSITNEWAQYSVEYTAGTAAEVITLSPNSYECFIDDIAVTTSHTEEADVPPVGAVLYENFNKFLAGSEATPVQGDLKNNTIIPDTLTIVPGWSAEKVYQSAGSAFLAASGYLHTPTLNLSANAGTFTMQVRAKCYGGDLFGQSSVIGALYDLTGGTATLVETQYVDVNTEYGDYTTTFNRGTEKCYVEIYFYAGEGWIDEIALVQPVSDVTAPVAEEYSNLTATGFTANWQAVEGADSYLLSVYERGNGTRTYVLEDKSVTGTSYEVTGVDTSKPYYYNVKAVKGDKQSVQSNQIEVLGLPEPELLAATNVTSNSFDANWNPVDRATSYELTAYVNHKVTADETYDILDEDFDGFKSGTIDSPASSSVLEWNINNYISRADWIVRNRIDAAGTVGLDNSTQSEYGTSWMHSPVLNLSNGNGVVNVSMKVYGKDVKKYTVTLYDSNEKVLSQYEGSASAEWSTADFTLTGGTSASYISIDIPASQTGQLFIDKLNVNQKLAAGDSITVPYYGAEIYSSSKQTTKTVSVPDWKDSDTYSYTVVARRTYSSAYIVARYIYSHKPTPIIVTKGPNVGVNDIDATEATELEHYNILGQRIDVTVPGLHIVKMSDGTSKKVYVK